MLGVGIDIGLSFNECLSAPCKKAKVKEVILKRISTVVFHLPLTTGIPFRKR